MKREFSTLGEFLAAGGGSIQTGPFGTKLKASEYTATGAPVISVGEVGVGRIRLHEKTPRVDASVWERMPEYLLKPGDIVFGRKGAVERSAQVQQNEDGYFLGSDGIRVRLNETLCEPKFVAYHFQTAAHRTWMIQHAAGSTMPSLNEGIIRRIPLRLPPLAEQKRIAGILGALDDKIEINRRMNQNLEAVARALFKSWFVDFDPVRAKADGQAPSGLDPATAALFPSSFQDSPLGPIPTGWRVAVVEDILRISRESLDPGSSPDECFEHFSLPAFDAGQKPAQDLGGDIKSLKFVVTDDCVLVSKLNPRTPRVWIPSFKGTRRQVASTEFLVCIGDKTKSISREFIFCLSRSDACLEHLGAHAGGTSNSHQRVRPQDFLDYRFSKAPPALIDAFTAKTKPIFDQIAVLRAQSTTLATLRDTLLPKLLSGEISTGN